MKYVETIEGCLMVTHVHILILIHRSKGKYIQFHGIFGREKGIDVFYKCNYLK